MSSILAIAAILIAVAFLTIQSSVARVLSRAIFALSLISYEQLAQIPSISSSFVVFKTEFLNRVPAIILAPEARPVSNKHSTVLIKNLAKLLGRPGIGRKNVTYLDLISLSLE